MRTPAPAHVRKLTHEHRKYHPNSAVPDDWNKDGNVYGLLLEFFRAGDSVTVDTHAVSSERAAALAAELRRIIATDLTARRRCSVRILDITDYWPGINNVDALADDLMLVARRSEVAAVVLVAADFLPAIQGSPHMERISRALKGVKKSLIFLDQLGLTFVAGARLQKRRIPPVLPALARLAPPPTRREFTHRVIHRSERWYGHFRMPTGAHVRTHYDCYYHVLRNDWLFRYVRHEAAQFINERKPDVLVGFGLADHSVQHLSTEMATKLNLEAVFRTPGSAEFLNEISANQRVLLVTDIVLTGKSASGICAELASVGAQVVGILSILSLSNSATNVGAGAPVYALCHLERPFYESPGDCPLCRCEYPPVDVSSVEDFRQQHDHIHPYDFWEAVQETRSFSLGHYVADGKHYTYRIDIHALCSLYADPIARQILHQLRKHVDISLARLIIFPDSPAARLLAEAIARVVHKPVLAISRELLDPLTIAQPFILPKELEAIRDNVVLVVDDGCNTLKTLAALDNLLTRVRATPIGYALALNRASKELTERRETDSKGKFHYYYHWPVAVYRAADCPECAAAIPA